MNTQFKIGDRVTVISNDNNNGTRTMKGSVGTVVSIPSWRTDVVDIKVDQVGFRCLPTKKVNIIS